jgi:hypothetical protein
MQGVLIFYYIGGAGGKFIANLLTYSNQVAISNYSIAQRNDAAEYNTALLATIPERSNSRSWLQLEHGCNQLWGAGVSYIKHRDTVPAAADLNDTTQIPRKWLPVMAHFESEVVNIQNYFDDRPQRLIIVDADPAFIDRAIRLKWSNPDNCLDLNIYREFKQAANDLLADYRINHWKPENRGSLMSVTDLADSLDLTIDFDAANAYIERYLAFHN